MAECKDKKTRAKSESSTTPADSGQADQLSEALRRLKIPRSRSESEAANKPEAVTAKDTEQSEAKKPEDATAKDKEPSEVAKKPEAATSKDDKENEGPRTPRKRSRNRRSVQTLLTYCSNNNGNNGNGGIEWSYVVEMSSVKRRRNENEAPLSPEADPEESARPRYLKIRRLDLEAPQEEEEGQ